MLVSAGFDAHRLDPFADCQVSEYGYAAMTASLRRACEAVGAPLGLVLEGGYSLMALSSSIAALAPVLAAETPPAACEDVVAIHPLAQRARAAARPVLAPASRARALRARERSRIAPLDLRLAPRSGSGPDSERDGRL